MNGQHRKANELVKLALGKGMFGLHLHSLLSGERGLVVAFHRVNQSSESDGLTLSPDIFERFCAFFSRHFEVVPLTTFVRRLEMGQPVGRSLAITFDDGYLDNYEIAAPILKRMNLPASFFVTTQFIGSTSVPWWDRSAGLSFSWMTWEHVRSLHCQGFEIGAHTRTHIDLGKVDGTMARDEVYGSRLDLEDKLGARVESFAYPFGRQDQITVENRNLVKSAGFRCCCSCFGGSNTKTTNPFFLRRTPISSWFTTPYNFGFDFLMQRV